MKALVKKEPREGLWMADVPEPTIGHDEVLIKILKTAICGTDLHIYKWDEWAQKTIKTPMTIGHEFVGRVEALGEHVKDVRVGDIVSGEGHIVCGRCRNCLAGRRHLCKDTKGVGVNRDGAFATYLKIPIQNVWHCDPSIPLDILSIFDPYGNAAHTALSFDVLGEDVLITGAGPIGLMAAAIVRHAGARKVCITDVNKFRLKMAEDLGVDLALDVSQMSVQEAVQKLGLKEGFDVGLEMSGHGQALNDMINNMAHGGKIAMLGIQSADTKIDWNKVIFNMLTLKGIYGREMFETWYKMTSMIQSGLNLEPLITHRMHFTEFQKGFELMRAGQCGKVILDWEGAN